MNLATESEFRQHESERRRWQALPLEVRQTAIAEVHRQYGRQPDPESSVVDLYRCLGCTPALALVRSSPDTRNGGKGKREEEFKRRAAGERCAA